MKNNFIVSKGTLCFFFPFDIANPMWSKSEKRAIINYEKECQRQYSVTANIDLKSINNRYEKLISKRKTIFHANLVYSNIIVKILLIYVNV